MAGEKKVVYQATKNVLIERGVKEPLDLWADKYYELTDAEFKALPAKGQKALKRLDEVEIKKPL